MGSTCWYNWILLRMRKLTCTYLNVRHMTTELRYIEHVKVELPTHLHGQKHHFTKKYNFIFW
jgi:hypothetical protein